jgi:hypothetical protein
VIRAATADDIPRLLEMGEKFAERANLKAHVGYDPASMDRTFATMIEYDSYCLFIGQSGAIGGVVGPHPFNNVQMVADELFWWSEGREGLKLLDAYEAWVAERGAIARMSALEAVDIDRVEKILARRGFEPVERAYIKVN